MRKLLRPGSQLLLILLAGGLASGLDIQTRTDIPKSLNPFIPSYSPQTSSALKALKRGIERFSSGWLEAAVEELATGVPTGATALDDYALLYRAKANLMLRHEDEALRLFRLVETQYPESSQLMDAIMGKCEALTKLHKSEEAIAILQNLKLEQNSEVLYQIGHAWEEAGNKGKAIAAYLRLYSNFVNSKNAAAAEQRLQVLTPGFLSHPSNFNSVLQRGQNLLRAGRNREANALLLKFGKVKAPDALSAEKRRLLIAEAAVDSGKTSIALPLLEKIREVNPGLHARALHLRAVCYRRLHKEEAFIAAKGESLRLYPQSPETEKLLYSVATYFDIGNDMSKALDAYRTMAEKFPRGEYAERASWKVALYTYFQKHFEEALGGLWNYLRGHPQPSSAAASAYWMARCYAALGDTGSADTLHMQVRRLSNHGYYGQRSLEDGAALKEAGSTNPHPVSSVDFTQLIKLLDSIQLSPVRISEPSPATALIIERARQLLAADLPDLAIAELRSGAARTQPDVALNYVISRVYEQKDDYYGVIATLRRAIPDYDGRPLAGLPDAIWELLFPVQHWRTIKSNAEKHNVDPNLILGIIRQESAFEEKAHSRANARGLMQVLPSTGRTLARQAGMARYSTGRLLQADTNIALGTRYLAGLLERFSHREELALAAYNAGDSRVETWLRDFGKLDMAEFIERIPFSETRSYIKQVLTNRAYYRLLTPSLAGSLH